jgi:hypothetical protein
MDAKVQTFALGGAVNCIGDFSKRAGVFIAREQQRMLCTEVQKKDASRCRLLNYCYFRS